MPGAPREHGLTDAARLNAQDDPTTVDDARLRWTSVPRWPAPQLPAATSYLACCFGDAGERQARALLEAAAPDVPARTGIFAAHWNAATETALRRLVEESFTGVRIILAGPEAVVMRAAALAKRLGATSEELVLIGAGIAPVDPSNAPGPPPGEYVSGTAGRRVFCAACRACFDAVASLDEVVTCPGCAADLTVNRRFSRPHAAYFGWPTGLDLHQ